MWYRHDGWNTGTGAWASGNGKKVGEGLNKFKSVFATQNTWVPPGGQVGAIDFGTVIYGIQS